MSTICFLIYDYTKKGGAERASSKLAHELAASHDITIISVFNEYEEDAYIRDKRIKYYRIINSKGSITKNIGKITKKIRKTIKIRKIEIVLAVDMATAFMAVLGTKLTGAKLIVCDRSSVYNETMYRHLAVRFYAWIGIHFADVLQVMTRDGKRGCIAKYHIKENKVVVIPNWIDGSAITNYAYNFHHKKIISVGRAAPEKNYEELMNLAERIKLQAKGWEWHIWGDFNSTYGESLLKEIKKRKLNDFLIHKGTSDNLYEEYPKYSFFVITSKFEGMPNAILEAQGAKLPVIAYDCKTGPSELIQDGVNGYLVRLNDIDTMERRITDLIQNKETAETLSRNSNLNYERFSKEKIMIEWNRLLGGNTR